MTKPLAPGESVVRAACPHDCPDTCAMLVTVREERGRRVAVRRLGDAIQPIHSGVLARRDEPLTPAAREFVSFLVERVGGRRA